MDTKIVSGITAHEPGYISEDLKDLEAVVGLQTDKPLKRAFMPYGGIKMAEQACSTYGYEPDPELHKIFTEYCKTHNQGVFDAYTPEMKKARHNKIITGLPDTYGRGRIVGDYRRVALYGIDFLIEQKKEDFANCGSGSMTDDIIRQREELAMQIKALGEMKVMAEKYGFDISQPAKNAKEAVQWLYFGYLAAIKTQNGAAMSVGRVSTFLDIYIERSGSRHFDRERGTGIDRPLGYEVPYGEVRSYSLLQPAVLRRPGMGYPGSWRYRRRRPFYGYQERLPFPAHFGEYGSLSGAEPDCSVFLRSA